MKRQVCFPSFVKCVGSSAVEHPVYTRTVGGSKPSPRTIFHSLTGWLFLLGFILLPSGLIASEKEETPKEVNEISTTESKSEESSENSSEGTTSKDPGEKAKKVFVVPVDGPITTAITYIIRRGVKEAIEAEAEVLILHMDTPGGSVGETIEIMGIIEKFPHQDQTYTFIDKWAVSAGAFISCGTRNIYMAKGAIIGASAPISSTGEDIPTTGDKKVKSVLKATVRGAAQTHGHRAEVFEAMIDDTLEVKIGDKVISPAEDLLTLTYDEAEKTYGSPATPLLSKGTVEDIDTLIEKIAGKDAQVMKLQPSGYEDFASWLVPIAPVLISVAVVLAYIEFQSPGFGIFGITGLTLFVIAIFGHYVAALTGHTELVIVGLGFLLIIAEIIIAPGILIGAIPGMFFVFLGLFLMMVDYYPTDPFIPTMAMLYTPILKMSITFMLILLGVTLITWLFPQSPLFNMLVLAEGESEPIEVDDSKELSEGQTGVSTSPLRPSGTADFGDGPVDVVTEADFIEADTPIRILAIEGYKVIVEKV